VVTSEKNSGDNTFEVSDVQNAVFLVGKGWRENKVSFDKFVLNIATFGVWQFSDAESVKMSQSILESYTKIFGEIPNNKIQIALVPIKDKTGRWEAETRGNTLTIVSGDMPFKTNSLQRLHEQLRHELFHLWIPNDLALTGNYDWFYEGFAVYQSLRTGVQMNRIRFEDFLDTLGTAYYLVNFNEQQTSLIDASKTIQSGTNPQVYSKGMIAAFICDAAILEKSKGRSSIEEIFRRIYQEHHLPNKPQNGNRAVLNILKTKEELRPVVEKYIEGAGKIVWTKYLDNLGIEAIETDFKTQLKVKKKLSGRQKDLLDKLGYNNWRKISKK
jgi:predicted metalloprotease with PDZ domain